MMAAHYKGGHHQGNDLGLHYTALPPIVASCPYSDQLLVTPKFCSPGANRPSQARSWSPISGIAGEGAERSEAGEGLGPVAGGVQFVVEPALSLWCFCSKSAAKSLATVAVAIGEEPRADPATDSPRSAVFVAIRTNTKALPFPAA